MAVGRGMASIRCWDHLARVSGTREKSCESCAEPDLILVEIPSVRLRDEQIWLDCSSAPGPLRRLVGTRALGRYLAFPPDT